MNEPYLKKRYRWKIQHGFLLIHLIIFWVLATTSRLELTEIESLWKSVSIRDGIVVIVVMIVAFVLDGFFSATGKARIVYWRVQDPLPGCRAFSYHLSREPRAKRESLVKNWGELPTAPSAQNELWYRMYREYKRDIRVIESHHDWLFSRDLTTYALLLTALLGIGMTLTDTPLLVTTVYFVCLVLQYLVCMVSARNNGTRFVCTVLAVASSSPRISPNLKNSHTRSSS